MYIRPYPLEHPDNSYLNALGQGVNSNKVVAGRGIKITSHNNSHIIEHNKEYANEKMRFIGNYDFNAEYFVNDVVTISSSISGSSVGTWVCINYVPAGIMTSDLLIGTVAPNIDSYGGSITEDYANGYRRANNIYYPTTQTFTPIAGVAESYWTVTASQSFWQILGGSGGLNWMSDYESSASYAVNDVVRVFPNASSSYVDWDNSPLTIGTTDTFTSSSNCPICAGLFICVQPVPTFDERNDYNIAYPIYPEIPLNLQMTAPVFSEEGTSSLNANIRYWEAMSPMFAAQLCNNQTMFVNGFLSGSNFNMGWLPYTPE
jgi:hypothetical protein